MNMRTVIIGAAVLAATCWADEPRFSVGSKNPALYEGARALLAGRDEEGVTLTLQGLEAASNRKEEEVALSNLCSGYTNLGDFVAAEKYCDILLQRNDRLWRPYTSKALIFIRTNRFPEAEQALIKAEALNPAARAVKVARALYLDATEPVRPDIEIDDRSAEIP